jgi:serine protease Do
LKPRHDTGLYTLFSVRGDFEVTLSFEVLKADRPKTGYGVGPVLYAANHRDSHESEAVSLARRLLPDGKAVFVSDHLRRQAKWAHKIKSLPPAATAGRLRLERQGAVVRFRVSEGNNPKFVTVAEVEFGRADIHLVQVGGSTGRSESGLDLRLLELTVRAEALPGLSGLGRKPAGDPGIQRLDATQLADLEKTLQKLYAQVAPSVVRIIDPHSLERLPGSKGQTGFSGVIVSPSGEILTCAHHGLAPKTKVMVVLADGRKVKATILGRVKRTISAASRYSVTDVGMALLDEKGKWPAATLGPAAGWKKGDLCFALGQPDVHYHPGQPPLLRLGRLLSPHPLGEMRSSTRMLPGDSGSPLFDLKGRVLGVRHEMESLAMAGTRCSPVEGFLKLRDRLRAGEVVEYEKALPERLDSPRNDPWGSWEPTAELTKALSAAHKSTVEVLGDGKAVALGLIVREDGWVLTKRTELSGPGGPRRLVCRLADGSKLEAQVAAESREHDLALVEVPAKGLPAVRWGKPGGPRVGQLVASLGPRPQPLHYGVVGALRVNNPGIKGYLPISGKPAPKGLRGMTFVKFLPSHLQVDEARGLLEAGDLITHLDDVPTPSADEFVKARDKRTAAPDALAGEWIKLTVERRGKTSQVFLPLVDSPTLFPSVWKQARWNVRRDGFPNVFSHDGGIAYDRCGGPVVDRSGQVIGINIARADPMRTFAVPSDVVQKVVAELKARPR